MKRFHKNAFIGTPLMLFSAAKRLSPPRKRGSKDLDSRFRGNDTSRSGVALVLALTILAVLTGIAAYLSIHIGMELTAAKGFLSAVKARAYAEAGLARAIAQIRKDARATVMFDPDFKNAAAFPDMVHRRYSTRALPGQGVWGDATDDDGDGIVETDEDEIVIVDDKGTTEESKDDNGYYTIVRDANAMLDLNSFIYADSLVQFPTIRKNSLDPEEAVNPGSVAGRILDSRASLPAGRYTSIDQLRSVLGREDFSEIEDEIDHGLTLASSSAIVSGGLVARYYGLKSAGGTFEIDHENLLGVAVDHGSDGPFLYPENVFSFNNPDQFAFKEETNALGLKPAIPNFGAAGNFAVVWTGYVFIPNNTPITFLVDYNGGLRMRIADVVIAKTSAHWNPGNSGEVVVTATFDAGWQSVLIEYYSTGAPSISIHWDGGYHYIDPSTGSNTPADPDIDLRSDNTRMPMASFGFKAGGIYEISSTGVVRDKEGHPEAEVKLRATVKIWDYVHESTIEDFSRQGAAAVHVTFDDSCPLHPIGDSTKGVKSEVEPSKKWSHEFDPVTKLRNYNTMYNAVKLGYWENFDDVDFIGSTIPGEAGVYPFFDPHSLRSAWKGYKSTGPRLNPTAVSETEIKFLEADGDDDRELVIVSPADVATGEPWYFADLVGRDGDYLSPISNYTFTNFWYRFDEDDNRGPLDRENYEDQFPGGSTLTNFDGSIYRNPPLHNGSPDRDDIDPEDYNRNRLIDGPHPWWVGWGYLRFNGFDNHFGIKQEGFGPGEDLGGGLNNDGGPEFETRVNDAIGVYTQHTGYTYKKTFAVAAQEDGLYYYDRTPYDSAASGFRFFLDRQGEASATSPKTVGFNSWGNESARPRHIDNVRVIPVNPSAGTFTSAPIEAGEVEEWGVANFTTYQNQGTQVALTVGPEGNSTAHTVTNGTSLAAVLGGTPNIQYSARLSMDLRNASGNVELNYDTPVFSDITITYLTKPRIMYYRRE